MEAVWQELRFAARTLAKSRGFSLAAILTLALGMGATTAIFSALHAVIFNPLPFPDASRIVLIYGRAVTTENFDQWQQQVRGLDHFSALSIGATTLTGLGDAQRLRTLTVTEEIFPLLAIRPVLGRGFLPEDRSPENDRVVMVSHRFWQERLDASPGALGQALVLDREPHTIIGVLPRETGALLYRNVDLWLPLRPARARGTSALARLPSGISLTSARTEAEAIASRFVRPEELRPGQRAVSVLRLKDQIVGDYRDSLLVLAGAVGFVLLIGCVNVANLFLARGAGRAREMAIRSALGASRWQVMRQTLSESFLLSLAGAAVGLLLAQWCLDALLHFLPYDIPRIGESRIGGIVFLFALALLFLTTLLAGLAPALQTSRIDVAQTIKEGSDVARAGRGGRRLRRVLIVSEVALAMVMLIGAGLLIKAFLILRPSSPGFDSANRLTIQVDLPRYRYSEPSQEAAFFSELRQRVAALPGVRAVAGTTDLPFTGVSSIADIAIDGKLVASSRLGILVHWRSVTADYFSVMGMPMATGRDFQEIDHPQSEKVAVINQAMARRFWPDQDPVGRKLSRVWQGGEEALTVVGIVQDARIYGDSTAARPELYQPFAQSAWSRMKLVIQTAGEPLDQAANVRSIARSMDPDVVVGEIHSLDQLLYDSVAQPRFHAVLLAGLAALALVLAVVGIHGVLAYSVNQRVREIGIRMALGAQRGQILRLVLREGLAFTLAGIALGIGLALCLAQGMRSLLYEVPPADTQTFLLTALLWCGVAVLACVFPARRAARVDPLVALRHE